MTEDTPIVASAEFDPDIEEISGVTLTLDQKAQWTLIPTGEERVKHD